MRKLNMLIALVAMIVALPAKAQLRFGVKAGAEFNSLVVTNLDYEKNNSTAFTAGVMADFTVPLIGVGVDASLMFSRLSVPKFAQYSPGENDIVFGAKMTRKNYMEVPVNIKYSLSLPAISKLVKPYVATGPCLAVRLSDDNEKNGVELSKTYVSWNVGAGVELIEHIQVGLCYHWGIGSLNKNELNWVTRQYDYKNNGLTVTAAYIF